MAEFVEVMKQARRICLEHPGDCDGCPLHDDEGLACRFDLAEKYLYDDTTERIVLKWAEEHPEPMYPDVAKKLGIKPIEIKKPASCGTCKYSDKSVWEAPCRICKHAHGDCFPDQREEENDAEVH